MCNQFTGRTQGKKKFSLFTPITIASLLPLLLPGNSLFQTSCHGADFPEISSPILSPSIHMATVPQLKENEIRSGVIFKVCFLFLFSNSQMLVYISAIYVIFSNGFPYSYLVLIIYGLLFDLFCLLLLGKSNLNHGTQFLCCPRWKHRVV